MNIAFPEVGPAQYYAVFEMKTDADLGHETRIVLGDRTTDVLWPLPNGHCRWSFQMPDYTDAHAEEMKNRLQAGGFGHFPTKRPKDRGPSPSWNHAPTLDEEAFAGFVEERAPWFNGRVENFNWRTIVRFERRLASSFGRDRVWLAGDAAHLIGPAGVLSMNLGMEEVNELAEAIERSLHNHGSLLNLDRYNHRWTDVWRDLEGIDTEVAAGKETDPWVAKYATRLMGSLPAYGADLGSLLDLLGLQLTKSQAPV